MLTEVQNRVSNQNVAGLKYQIKSDSIYFQENSLIICSRRGFNMKLASFKDKLLLPMKLVGVNPVPV